MQKTLKKTWTKTRKKREKNREKNVKKIEKKTWKKCEKNVKKNMRKRSLESPSREGGIRIIKSRKKNGKKTEKKTKKKRKKKRKKMRKKVGKKWEKNGKKIWELLEIWRKIFGWSQSKNCKKISAAQGGILAIFFFGAWLSEPSRSQFQVTGCVVEARKRLGKHLGLRRRLWQTVSEIAARWPRHVRVTVCLC